MQLKVRVRIKPLLEIHMSEGKRRMPFCFLPWGHYMVDKPRGTDHYYAITRRGCIEPLV
jgi:hypothetical protein